MVLDYIVGGRRVKKRVGPSKSLAELVLKDIEVKTALNDLGFLAKDSDLKKLFQEFLQYSNQSFSQYR